MRGLFLLFWALFAIPAHADGPYILPWEKVTELWLTPSQVRLYGPGALNSGVGVSPTVGCITPNAWCVADLRRYGVPADAKYAFLTGLLIITHGYGSQLAWMTVTMRRPGDTSANCEKYIGQVVEAHTGGGQRSGMATWVALMNGQVEYCFNYALPIGWPDWSSYVVNLSVQAWAR